VSSLRTEDQQHPARRRSTVLAAAICVSLPVVGLYAGSALASTGPHGRGNGTSVSAGGQAPVGNNGHIQIDEFQMDGGKGNDPHVACGFSVSFFGYDAGTQHATISVTPWAPTRGGVPLRLQTSWTTAVRTSGSQLDQNIPISAQALASTFAGVTPAKQGYHARVEVEATGSRGSDDKYHMVWIAPCSPGASASASLGVSAGAQTNTSPSAAREVNVVLYSRIGKLGAFHRGTLTAEVGQTVEFRAVVHNHGSAKVTEKLSLPQCDTGTMAPAGPVSIPAGGAASFTCTHFLAVTGPLEVRTRATPSGSTAGGTTVAPAGSVLRVVVRHSSLALKSLPKAAAPKPVVKAAHFTG